MQRSCLLIYQQLKTNSCLFIVGYQLRETAFIKIPVQTEWLYPTSLR